MLTFYLAALLIGLFSSVHCLGMCGGIMGVLSASLPPQVRENTAYLLLHIVSYNLGRIGAYAGAGALLGLFGGQLHALLSPAGAYTLLQLAAAILMSAIGLYLAGWFPRFAYVERIGQPLWRRLEPLGRRLLPVRSPWHALLYGLIWGWLPCGLVYSALLLSLAAPGPLEGALYMVLFGVGTLPAVLGIGMLSGQLMTLTRRPRVRQLAGVSLIILGLSGLLFAEQLHGLLPQPLQEQAACPPSP